MHVIQSQITNYSYHSRVQNQLKLVRWWVLEHGPGEGRELALPFTKEQEEIFIKFIDDHPANFPKEKREIFDSKNLGLPDLSIDRKESDHEKPCILMIRTKAEKQAQDICRRMDIVLLNNKLPVALPFDIAGEIVLEKAGQ